MATEDEIRLWIDRVSQDTGFGTRYDAYANMLRGINHRGLGNLVVNNQDNTGIVFFTRPDLNLSYDNIATHRVFMPLATQNAEYSLQRYIRTSLDPEGSMKRGITTPLFNHRQPFLTVLTNNLLSSNGWPDVQLDEYVSKEGVRKEVWSMVDGLFRIVNKFDLTMNFRNIQGDPITALFSAWCLYASSVKLGDMDPYPRNLVENKIDYMTRIYHLILDPSRRFVQKIAATGASYPTTVPLGAAFNFVGDETMVKATEQITINFSCIGADYNDPITFEEFNEVVRIFNTEMEITEIYEDGRLTLKGGGNYIKLLPEQVKSANYYGTPLIHPLTQELQWWVPSDEYNRLFPEG